MEQDTINSDGFYPLLRKGDFDIHSSKEIHSAIMGDSEDNLMPDELWLHIFLFIKDPKELYQLRKVCQDWKRLIDDDQLWHTLWTLNYGDEMPKLASTPSSSGLSSIFSLFRKETPNQTAKTTQFLWKDMFLRRYSSFYARKWVSKPTSTIIFLHLPQTTFIKGEVETLNAELWIHAVKPIPCSSVSVSLKAFEVACYAKGKSTHLYFNRKVDIPFPQQPSNNNPDNNTNHTNNNNNTNIIAPGEWRFPFTITLPQKGDHNESIPTTYHRAKACPNPSYLRCQLEARISNFPFDIVNTKPISIIKRTDELGPDPALLLPSGRTGWITKGIEISHRNTREKSLSMISTPQTTVHLGQKVNMRYLIHNLSLRPITSVIIGLHEYVSKPGDPVLYQLES